MRKCGLIMIIFVVDSFLASADDIWGANNQISLVRDMSMTCINNLHTDIYLPFGMGVADSNIILVSDSDVYSNCDITFYSVGSKKGVYLIIVVEFPDHTEGDRNACQDPGSTILIKEPTLGGIDVCEEVNKLELDYFATATYSLLSNATNVSVMITSKSLFETVKITVTAARKLSQYEKCNPVNEILCVIGDASVCISRELLCDNNINCGTAALNDEDVRICDESRYKRLWLVVASGIIMVMIIVFFLINFLRTCLPQVPDNFFIFNEDEDNKLILSTKFAAPSRLDPELSSETSSFRFKNIPLGAVLKEPFPKTSKKAYDENLEREQPEVELDLFAYKQEIRKSLDDLIDSLPLKSSSSVEIFKSPKKASQKKPRFDEEAQFVSIMDRIETYNTPFFEDRKDSRKKLKRKKP